MFDVRKYPLVSDQVDYREVEIILAHLEKVLLANVPGAIVEFGCYTGTTSLFIARLLREVGQPREFHVYDSFDGLPEKSAADASPAGTQYKAGELLASKNQLVKHFKQAGLPLPHIHKGWFGELADRDVPERIAFAFLDGDFYDSIWDSLKCIEHKLAPGAVIIVDDYQSEALPGTQRAVQTWLKQQPELPLHIEHSLGIIYYKG